MMDVKNKVSEDQSSLLYLAICSRIKAHGVIKKIEGFVNRAKARGYNSKSISKWIYRVNN